MAAISPTTAAAYHSKSSLPPEIATYLICINTLFLKKNLNVVSLNKEKYGKVSSGTVYPVFFASHKMCENRGDV